MPTNDISKIESEIKKIAKDMGASHFGIANIERAFMVSPSSFEESGKLLTGISIGVKKDDWIVDGLPQTDSEYRTDHYTVKIALALRIGDIIVSKLKGAGYKAHRLSHPAKPRATGLYKLIGNFAGIGWIGKNHLLITPDSGPRVALGAVLTDAPLTPTSKTPMENRCGNCIRCIDICPGKAFMDIPFDETNPLKSFITGRCAVIRGTINTTGWGGCGLCVKVCPYGIKINDGKSKE
jgi:epoxyqueuosine reductase QueG